MATQSRRRLLTTLSLAGAADYMDRGESSPRRARAEGFTDVRYVRLAPGSNTPEGIANGDVDFGINFASVLVTGLDRGVEMTVLGGVHVGCFELFAEGSDWRFLNELKRELKA
jgi:hypothetical protein